MASNSLLTLFGYLTSLVAFYTGSNAAAELQTPTGKLANIYHFIVVGGGTAGAVVASRLSEDPTVNVLLLEAGGNPTMLSEIPAAHYLLQSTQLNWKYVTAPQENACFGYDNKQCQIPSGKVLGGSSSINNMLYSRGNRHDYSRWAALGNYGWSWKDVLPYFLKSEDDTIAWTVWDAEHHHTGGYLTVSEIPYKSRFLIATLQATSEHGYPTRDINGEIQAGFMPVSAAMRNGARCSTAKAFIRPAAKRTNLHIRLNTFVTKILLDEKKRAYGIQFEHEGRKHRIYVSREVILSAGSVRSPQLLMLSGIGPKQHLQEHGIPVIVDLPGVGNNLQDHVMFGGLTWTLDEDISIGTAELFRPSNLLQWLAFKTGPLTTVSTETMGFVKTPLANTSIDWPDIQMVHVAQSSPTGDEVLANKGTFSIYPLLLRPKSRGFVKLRNTNPRDHPIIDPKYMTNEEDLNTLVEGIKMARAFGNASSYRQYGEKFTPATYPECENFHHHSDPYWICAARHYSEGAYHLVGTAKMGTKVDPMAVVDPELRVYNVSGLRVADASIMPCITSGNPGAPTIMIGEKAAHMIAQHWNIQQENHT